MTQQEFESRYAARWEEFAAWLQQSRTKRPRGQPPPPIDAFEVPARYRELCQHLALARDRQYSGDLIERLSRLALAGHQALYGARTRGPERVLGFLRAGFPRAVRREIAFVWLAALLFFGPIAVLSFAVPRHPDFAYVVLPARILDEFQQMYGDSAKSLGRKREADSDVAMFGFYIYNNVRIGFQTFAGGLLFGLGTLFYLLFNGLLIGTLMGYVVHLGLATNFFSFVSGHSAFELTAICLSGAAGLKLGYVLIAPGRRARAAALRTAAVEALPLVVGLAGMLLIAAAIEAFWSPRTSVPPPLKYGVGAAGWLLVLAYFGFVGRERGA
ncbi:MAG TPA: stage II sporulation protein M [Burkholderiales bacterium]|nr:stage II sporulation protein M [Burkholderiales bacterium]